MSNELFHSSIHGIKGSDNIIRLEKFRMWPNELHFKATGFAKKRSA